jgi:dienelactone hydrolase
MSVALVDAPPTTEQVAASRTPITSPIANGIIVFHGLALAVLVGSDGPGPWPAVRALVAVCVTAAAVWAGRSPVRRRGTTSVLVFGLAGVIAGIGIGAPHAVKAGASAESVSGIAALATGLTLAGLATVALVRRARRWRKLLVAPIGLGVVVLGVAPLALAVAVTNVPPLALGDETPADRGLPYSDVSIQASDGTELAAWYVPSTNGAAVVLLGGATNTRTDELDHAAVLASNGYGVLLLDARGHGDSDGDAMLWGWHGETDVRAAVDYLASRDDVTAGRVAAVGMSMGAEEAIGAAGADPRLLAVVAEGASARGARDEGDPARGIGGWLVRYIDWTTSHAADLMTSAEPPTKLRDAIAAAAPRPVMIIAAGTQPAEIDAAHAFEAAAPGSVEVWIAPGAGHTKAYDTYPAAWEARVIAFLDNALDVEHT